MKALVVYGSKNGSTKGIAEEIYSVLLDERFETQLMDAKEEIKNIGQYDLIVIGSSLYLRNWLKEPAEFVRENQAVLKTRSVWLFSSGLRSENPRSLNPKIVSEFRATINPRGHQFFSGSLEPEKLGLLHRFFLRTPVIRSVFPTGDFRNWNEIRSWARSIARSFVHSHGGHGQVVSDLVWWVPIALAEKNRRQIQGG
jgi:menaquinone-dependent protoporphyrinogen oxidase